MQQHTKLMITARGCRPVRGTNDEVIIAQDGLAVLDPTSGSSGQVNLDPRIVHGRNARELTFSST